MPHRVAMAAVLLTAAWLLAYGPTVAGGFIKDDFGWIHHSRIDGLSSVLSAFTSSQVFYRPMVQLSFGINEALFANNPVPYAVTNVLLGLACAVSIFFLGRAIGLAAWAALAGTAVWAFNFHGINMAIAWLSGRTSLLGTLFSTLAALAFVRNRALAAGICAFGAFLSKEEVLALPMILTAWSIINRTPVKQTAATWLALCVYFLLRINSGAVGVGNAPPYYRFTFDPLDVARNIFEYADRSLTLAIALLIATMLAFRSRPLLDDDDRRRLAMAAVWLIGGFAVTVWLPIRSSLYAVFPSVATAIITGVLLTAIVRHASAAHARRVAVAALLLPFLLLPLYWRRNMRWTELRDLSTATIDTIHAGKLEPRTLVVLEDDLSTRANFRHVFGALLPEASALLFRNEVMLWIEPPPPDVVGERPAGAAHVVRYRLVNGRIELAAATAPAN